MGIFTGQQKGAAEIVYEKDIKKYLAPKDGNLHILMVRSFSKWSTLNFGCEDKYTSQLDLILSGMQNDGYEIIDIKFNSLDNQGFSKNADGFHTLIIYK